MIAHAMEGDRARCLAEGMDGYLSKPIEPRALFNVLESLPRITVPVESDLVEHASTGIDI
jgi:CheY-like chemotaxis protein